MAYEKLILLAPCHGLEDFPLYHTGEDAASLLACWTSLWHPLFLSSAAQLPHVERCDYPPEDLANALLVLPAPCEAELDADLSEKATSQDATLIRGMHKRSEILKRALEPYGDAAHQVDSELVRDFLAYGFAFLQVEVLTQQMRYASCIDQTRIQRDLKEASIAAIDGDVELAREKLTSCHDALADERSHYYPVDVCLIDLTLLAVAETTLGNALDRQLADEIPQNFLASGETIQQLAQTNPAALQTMRSRLEAGTVGIAGGEFRELPLPLMSLDSATRQLKQGSRAYRQQLGQDPTSFGRRRQGFYPSLSEIIRYAGYQSALHMKFDEGQIPESSQGRTSWMHGDRKHLESYARAPLDAAAHETFLNLPTHLSETMDSDHVATRMFIHWPGQAVPWYDDLRRCGRYGTAIGNFVTVQEYFQELNESSTSDSFTADDYFYPYLKQAVASEQGDPISKWTDYWTKSVCASMQRGYDAIASCLSNTAGQQEFESVETQIDKGSTELTLDDVTALGSRSREVIAEQLVSADAAAGTIVNALSFPRRILVTTSHSVPAEGSTVYASDQQAAGSMATLVDVPAMGFACIQFHGGGQAVQGPDLAEGLTLRNEFFQATIDHETGALRSLKDYKSRNTRLSQQLGLRITVPKTGQPWVDRQAPVAYSVMAADTVEVTRNSKVFAEITSKGRMLALNGELVGEFVQRYQTTRGSRVLTLEIEITTAGDLLLDDPWESYYGCRFAFGDETAVFRAGRQLQAHEISRRRFCAPLFVDIDCGNSHTTILTGGLPYHRRTSAAQLDTLLRVRGETANRFRIGIGVDLTSATRSAIDFVASAMPASLLPGVATTESGWLFHVDAKNVVVTWWQPLNDGEGIRLRIVETEKRKSLVRLRSFKPWREACVVDSSDQVIETLNVNDGAVEFSADPHAFAELRLCW